MATPVENMVLLTREGYENIEKELVFRGIQYETPNVSMCAGCEIILEYHGREIDIKKAIELMEEIGYISKDNFEL